MSTSHSSPAQSGTLTANKLPLGLQRPGMSIGTIMHKDTFTCILYYTKNTT